MSGPQTLAVLSLIAISLPVQAHEETNNNRSLRKQKLRPRERRAVESSCEYNTWHPEPTNSDGCTNSPEYPREWEGMTLLFHSTFKECCEFFRPNEDCAEYNVCSGSSVTTTSDEAKCGKWHPNMKTKDGCSNSMDYPADWKDRPEYFFDTAKACCDMFFVGGDKCKVHDECEGGSPKVTTISIVDCDTVQWHPDMLNQDGCSNSLDYPEEWNEFYFFDTPEECCNNFFGNHGKPCKTYDSCNAMHTASPTTAKPTASPTTAKPTASPTTANPTVKPTMNPTTSPTTLSPSASPSTAAPVTPEPTFFPSISPTIEKTRYYQVFSTGICTALDVFTPHWMTKNDFYIDYNECCKNSWNTEPCLAAKPEGACCTPMPTRRPTRWPSSKPTIAPTSEPKTHSMSENSCPAALWHPSEDFSKCSNSFEYDSNWDSPPMNEHYLHVSLSGCCQAFFEQWGKACVYEDICDVPTQRPTTQQPTNPKCNATVWHPSEDHSKCTNSPTWPSRWDEPSLASAYLHETAQSCCQIFFFSWGKGCEIEDVCAQDGNPYAKSSPTSSPTKAGLTPLCEQASERWHPTTDKSKCSNSLDYPEIWNHSTLSSAYLHKTADDCCEMFFFSWGKSCVLEDVCAFTLDDETVTTTTTSTSASATTQDTTTSTNPTINEAGTSATQETIESPCDLNLWHPSSGMDSCINSNEYPSNWKLSDNRDRYLHDTKESCCEVFFFSQNKDCNVKNVCSGTAGTLKLPTPSANPTKTCQTRRWHPTQDFKSCTDSLDYPESWSLPSMSGRYMFETKEQCCEQFAFGRGVDCIINDTCLGTVTTIKTPTESPTISPSNEPCTLRSWHPLTNSKSCTNDLNYPESWEWPGMRDEYMFETAEDCCQKYFFVRGNDCPVEDECLGTVRTIAPLTDSPSSKPTEKACNLRSWHTPTDYTSCTNDLDYPESWEWPSMRDEYMFETAKDCCEKYFFVQGNDCPVKDECLGTVGLITLSDGSPTSSPTEEACNLRSWHTPTDYTSCSNDLDYPESWEWPSMRDEYIFETAEGCCEKYFFAHGKDCLVKDSCLDTVTTIKPPGSVSNIPTLSPIIVSADTMKPTDILPKSESIDCDLKIWHPSSGFQQCTNSPVYPGSWDSPTTREKYLYDTKESCCEVFFHSHGKDCEVEDFCSKTFATIESPTKSPTIHPTNPPTSLPTRSPVTSAPTTGKPTEKPTRPPTSSPTETRWYPDRNPDYSKGKCITTVPIPEFRTTYKTLKECCESNYRGQSSGACLLEGETETSTTSTSSTSTILQYYSNPSTGMCAIVDENTPVWISERFTSWEDCCKVGWVYDECMKEDPNKSVEEDEEEEPTSTTTSTSTTAQVQYYSNPSNGMCSTVDESTPSWINTFFTDWEECCKVGWVFDKCMAEAPMKKEADKDALSEESTSTTTSSTTTTTLNPCASLLWHPVTASKKICTNSVSYPSTWNDPAVKDDYLFATAKECCKKFYKGDFCSVVDTCY